MIDIVFVKSASYVTISLFLLALNPRIGNRDRDLPPASFAKVFLSGRNLKLFVLKFLQRALFVEGVLPRLVIEILLGRAQVLELVEVEQSLVVALFAHQHLFWHQVD